MAKKVKSQVKAKQPKKQAEKLIAKVPVECVFYCHDGKVFTDIKELAEGLAGMSDEIFAYHANREKNDFVNWVRDVIADDILASELGKALARQAAAEVVASRIAFLCD